MSAKIKILYVLTKEDVGGAQKYVNDLVNNLDKDKFETKILTGGPSTDSGQVKIRFLSNSLKPHFLFINDWLAIVELWLAFRKERPDIIHLNNSKAGVVGAIAAWLYNASGIRHQASRMKVIFTAHGWVFNPDNQLPFGFRNLYALLHKLAGLFQDKIINVSEYDKKLALENRIASPEKLITIRNGIDHKNLKFLDKKTARKALAGLASSVKHQASGGEIWIGSVGRLVREKNYSDLVTAASLLKNKNLKFFVIGSGPEKRRIQLLITNYQLRDRFFIIENLAPADIYLKAFDIFALPSIKEGLPYTIIEAMAAGLPIVATRVGGIPEVLENRGLVMPSKEPAELARAISFLIDRIEKSVELGKEANKYVKEELTIDKMVEATKQVYLS